MGLDLNSSTSKSKSTVFTGAPATADNGSVALSSTGSRNVNILPGGTSNTRSGNTTIGKGANVTYTTNVTGASAQEYAAALGNVLNSQANLSPGNSKITGLPEGPAGAGTDNRTQFIFMGVVALLVVVLLVFRRS